MENRILFSCSSRKICTYYICWINERPFPPLAKEKNYLEIRNIFQNALIKGKTKLKLQTLKKTMKSKMFPTKLWGTVKVIFRRNYMAANAFFFLNFILFLNFTKLY